MNKIDDDFNEQCANQYVQDHESENEIHHHCRALLYKQL